MNKAAFSVVVAGAIALGLAFRLAWLDLRPMHHDEANQAVRFGELLETGDYRYDRNDHHGPTLYYLTLPVAWARGQTTLASLDERTLRVVPGMFGVGFILLLPLMARGLGRVAVAAGALLAALSPALTYYSRFYIQESVLLFFAAGFLIALGRWAIGGGVAAALAAGVCAGLALATKETAAPILLAAVVACAAARASAAAPSDTTSGEVAAPWPRIHLAHVVGALVVAAIVAVTLYSSLFTNLSGVADAVQAGAVYAQRGLEPGTHGEPWDYYLRLLGHSASGGLVWTEGLVLALALVGAMFAWRTGTGGFWPRYVCVYSTITLVAFSVVRYKTPWNVLPFYGGAVALAGFGAAALLGTMRSRESRGLLVAVLVAVAAQLGLQSWRANFRYPADPRNPYVYAHTSHDFLRLVTRVEGVSRVHPDRERMLVAVVAGPYEQWPLPWYLRRMTRVGYWTSAAAAGPLDRMPFIIASSDFADAIEAALGDRYLSEFYGLRPGVLLTVFIERGLWDRFLSSKGSGQITDQDPGR
jgi:uncharacterized protein (TIGR03663 family)